MKYKIHYFIHDLNPWGGQDKSTLEVINRLDSKWDVSVSCFSVHGLTRPNTSVFKLGLFSKAPASFKIIFFQVYSLILYFYFKFNKTITHSTGTCSLLCEKRQIQFIHSAWSEVLKANPQFDRHQSILKKTYHSLLLKYNVFTEYLFVPLSKSISVLSKAEAFYLTKKFSIPPERIKVVPHGVNSNEFKPVSENEKQKIKQDLKISGKIMLFVGEFHRKGLENAIRGFAQVHKKIDQQWCILAVGSGNKAYFKKLCHELGVDGKVHISDHSSNVLKYYQAADLFLLPTYYEPFGMVILEAMSFALPCIVSKCAGASELAKDGESVFLIQDPADVNEIAKQLLLVTGNKEIMNRAATLSRKIAESRSWDVVKNETEEWLMKKN